VTALERIARDIGIALGECGAEESSTLVGEVAESLSDLAREPSVREDRRQRPPRRSRRPAVPGAA